MASKTTKQTKPAESVRAAAASAESTPAPKKAKAPAAKSAAKPAAKATKPKAKPAAGAVFPTEMMPGFDDIMDFSKGNVEAAVQAGTIFAQGSQELNALWFGAVKTALDEGAAAAKALMECHSLPEWVDMQNDLAKEAYEKAFTESRNIFDASVKLSEDAIEPLTERFAQAMEHIGQQNAA
jgi:phasin family protein